MVRRYLRTLQDAGLLKLESLSELGICGAGAALESLVSALQAEDSQKALAALAKPPPPRGPLAVYVDSYIELHQALGKQYRSNRYDLLHLDRFLKQQGVLALPEVTAEILEQWTKPMACIAVVRVRKMRLVRRFFDYLVGVAVLRNNPVTRLLLDAYRSPSTSITPYIFTSTQIKAILAEAHRLPRTRCFPLRPETCHAMIAILYGLGLRCGEACRLRLRDLDLSQQVLFIRETKFHKNRYVPFGPKIGHCLQEFLHVRRRHLAPVRADDPLFVTLWRAPLHDNTIREPFTQILQTLGIHGVQEVADARVGWLTLSKPYKVQLLGKGRKWRTCPLWDTTVGHLQRLIEERRLQPGSDDVLFVNRFGRQLTRSGIEGIVERHVSAAATSLPSLKDKNVTPHTFRHTTAMHLLQSGVEINVIRSWLGHVSLTTTNRYVEIDLKMKSEALKHCRLGEQPVGPASWQTDPDILTWLDSL